MNIMSYNSKVLITNVEQNSMASMACLIDDCVVFADDNPVTSTRDFTERVKKAPTQNRIATLLLERPVDVVAIQTVKAALEAEKTTLIDPKMAYDVAQIGLEEVKRIQAGSLAASIKGIYQTEQRQPASPGTTSTSKQLVCQTDVEEVSIDCDPCNLLLMQKTPPRPGSMMSTSSTSTKP